MLCIYRGCHAIDMAFDQIFDEYNSFTSLFRAEDLGHGAIEDFSFASFADALREMGFTLKRVYSDEKLGKEQLEAAELVIIHSFKGDEEFKKVLEFVQNGGSLLLVRCNHAGVKDDFDKFKAQLVEVCEVGPEDIDPIFIGSHGSGNVMILESDEVLVNRSFTGSNFIIPLMDILMANERPHIAVSFEPNVKKWIAKTTLQGTVIIKNAGNDVEEVTVRVGSAVAKIPTAKLTAESLARIRQGEWREFAVSLSIDKKGKYSGIMTVYIDFKMNKMGFSLESRLLDLEIMDSYSSGRKLSPAELEKQVEEIFLGSTDARELEIRKKLLNATKMVESMPEESIGDIRAALKGMVNVLLEENGIGLKKTAEGQLQKKTLDEKIRGLKDLNAETHILPLDFFNRIYLVEGVATPVHRAGQNLLKSHAYEALFMAINLTIWFKNRYK